jgi:hypothetical protein
VADAVSDDGGPGAGAGSTESTPSSAVTPLVAPDAGPGVEHRSYRGRFAAVYGILGAIVVAAVGIFAFVVSGGGPPESAAWSSWQPSGGSSIEQASEIASRVAPQYRLAPGGAQLVTVQANEPTIQNVPLEDVALAGGSGADADYKIISTSKSVVFVLCGLGDRCKIKSGTPSQERARLLRREALELALYTFKYVDGVDNVIALIPPPPEPNTNWALFFQKKEFKNELSHPLSQTLPAPADGKRLVPASVAGNANSQTIERLTRQRWFTSEFRQLQNGNAILVLDPVIAAR